MELPGARRGDIGERVEQAQQLERLGGLGTDQGVRRTFPDAADGAHDTVLGESALEPCQRGAVEPVP